MPPFPTPTPTYEKPNAGRGDNINKYQIIFLLSSRLVFNVTAVSTNNRILFGTLIAGSALATSLYGDYLFNEFELTLLTTAVLILTFPRPSESAVKTCTDYPGYTDDPLLGCYRIYPPGELLSYADAEKLCASDGGRLVLINSEAEAQAFREKMKEIDVKFGYIQGTRTGKDAPWTDNNGNPLPYLPARIFSGEDASRTKLTIIQNGFFAIAVSYKGYGFVLCEI
uniref:Uncharacterized protein LOC111116424 n=1 Tax=Crassostrea virginica TaxID=6565 RepID=A0A8B8C7N6_CRAVI|nr:uncharacterized protein LOC111116424 [Crassostrea virginica]